MSDLREQMKRAVSEPASVEDALEQTRRRIQSRQRRRSIAAGATALGLFAVVVGVLLTGFWGKQTPANNAATPSGGAPSLEPVVVADVHVGGFPSAIIAQDGIVWVAVESRGGESGSLARIDPVANEMLRVSSIEKLPGQLVSEAGSLWLAFDDSVARVDPETGEVIAEISGPGTFVTHAAGSVWALSSANAIARIDPSANEVVATVTLDLPAHGYITAPPVGTPDAVWVMATVGTPEDAQAGSGLLYRIDPNTDSVVAKIRLEMAGPFAVGETGVWVVGDYGPENTSLHRIDTATNQLADEVDLAQQWTPFAMGAGRLWLMGGTQPQIRVVGLNLTTLELESPVVVGELPAFEGSGVYEPATGSLWISLYDASVTKVELRATSEEMIISTPN